VGKYFFALACLISFYSSVHAASIEIPVIPDKVFEIFHTRVRPRMMEAYQAYYENVGEDFDAGVLAAYRAVSPQVAHVYDNNVKFWYPKNPELFDDFARVPTPVKIAHERFLFGLWGALQKFSPEKITNVNQKFSSATKMIFAANAVRTRQVRVPEVEQQRLERLLNDLRNSAPDTDMRQCFRIYGVPSEIINAFNTGCNIFVNNALYSLLNDDELRAVISHEISHGSNGDGIKTFSHIFSTVVEHTFKLSMENLHWLLTDDEMEYMKETYEVGSGEMIIAGVASRAPALEIRADQNGARLLNSAGYSAQPMIDALTKLHEKILKITKGVPQPKHAGVRNYPSLDERINAIKEVMKF
jgi:hypothetical protein